MTPYDKAMDRAGAAALLKVPLSANQGEIRQAWKRRAFEMHPDRGHSTAEEFVALNEAYEHLLEGAEPAEAPTSITPGRPTRPSIDKRVDPISEEAQAMCQKHLEENGLHGSVAIMVRRSGRRVSYIIESPMAEGANHVVVAAGELENRRGARPIVVEFESPDGGKGTFDVPCDLRSDLFPGARSVRMHFGSDAA